ncbi:efflux RND transporter periplasmic adaptor subunit [Pseudoruegeria sp. SK021]|uniref:efflux RND transporter periplasmic adaptor subunit n=1 Tax=Pseudoruegeria sp. SK021 TaxID=1933035 RepID=UPI000A21E1FB|nr:efflux RND transporter periplasmic adaptor subunit [Pseudoruegeria sp. SK021]OSP54369.1 efflux transporter periplasmic adaptor subunit [Pseudoruegeria sp. SK021]
MRRLLTLVVATATLAGAYVVTFGVPAPLLAMVTSETGTLSTGSQAGSTEAPSGVATGGRPGGGPGGGRSRTTTVVTTALEMRPYDSILNAIGTASARHSVDVRSDTAGTVIETHLSANRDVEEGDVLVRFDARTEALNLVIAQAELEQTQDIVDRYERLRQNGSSTVTDVTLSEARIALRLAEAAVELAEVAVEDRSIRAPISGRLGLSDVDVGDALTNDSFVVSIDQSETLVINFELPERAIGLLAEAKEVLASTSAFTGRVFAGQIVSFDSRIDPVTRSVTVKAEIDNADGQLWPGMTFAVRLIQQSAPLPMLPSTAITWSRDGSSVWIDADGVAQQVPVTILFRQDESVWLDADLPEGAMIVSEGAQKLRAGTRIATTSKAPAGGRRPGTTPATASAEPQSQPQATSTGPS